MTTALSSIRSNAAKALTYALWAHIPIFLIIGWIIDAEGLLVTTIAAAVVIAGPTIVLFTQGDGALHRYLVSAGMVLMAAFMVFIFRGHPWQIDAHMYFFAALAVNAALCCWRCILVAAAVTAVHHLLFNFMVPAWVFPEGADFVRVVFHAVIVVLESGALFWATKTLAGTFEAAEQSEQAARESADQAREEADVASKATADAEQALEQMRTAEAEKAAMELKAEHQQQQQQAQEVEARNQLADEFEKSLRVTVDELMEVSGGLDNEVKELQMIATDSSSAMQVATGATENVSQNVSSVASSAEEMSASVSEIARQVTKSTQVVEQAREHAGLSDKRIKELAERADKINNVLGMIGEIAEQTNLLALNATIEAARAGEAGKGFAVVASEVKSLANQSASATEEIGQLLTGIREATNDAVEVNQEIVKVIGEIGENASSIAAAVEEQSAATEEIARAAQMAAGETVDATEAVRNLETMSGKVQEVASLTANATSALSEQTKVLREKSDSFVVRIKS